MSEEKLINPIVCEDPRFSLSEPKQHETLLDLFAGLEMAAITSSEQYDYNEEDTAEMAYKSAKAMLKERMKYL